MACLPPPNLCFANLRPARPNPNKHTHTETHSLHPECFTEAERHRSQTQKPAAASEEVEEEGGPEKSLRAPSTVYRRPSPSLTLLWMTTTLWESALSHVSMALQMLQILSRAGAWWSGQPKSNTWGTREAVGHDNGRTTHERRGEMELTGLPSG